MHHLAGNNPPIGAPIYPLLALNALNEVRISVLVYDHRLFWTIFLAAFSWALNFHTTIKDSGL